MRFILAAAFCAALCGAGPPSDPRVTIDVRDASIVDVVSLLARQAGQNVITDESVRPQKVTLQLHDVSFREALELLADSHGLRVIDLSGILIVGSREAMNRQYAQAGNQSAVVIRLVHASSADVAKTLGAMLPSGSIIVPDERTNSVLVSADLSSIARAQSVVAELDRSTSELRPRMETTMYRLRYARAADVVKDLKTLLPDGTFVAQDQENAVLVTGDESAQSAAQRAISSIDVAGPEVLFEVRVADVTPVNDSSDFGLEFGGLDLQGQPLAGATTYAFAGGSAAINVRLNALVSNGHAQILATPRLVTLNGEEADLLIGETYPVVYTTSALGGSSVQFVDIGVKLRLTPVIGLDGSVTAELHPEYSELQGFTTSGYPIIANRKIDSTLRVRSDQTIVLGGLLRDTSSETIERIPWLSQIPVLGKIFQDRQASHERDEIVFLITPRIVDADAPPAR